MEELTKTYYGCPVRSNDQNLVYWIARYTHTCVYGPQAASSWVFGYISVVSWLCAQLPQIITNHANGSVEGISLEFLACWLIGDFLNFSSCLLIPGLPFFQTLLAGYYVFVDLIVSGQYYYYTRPHRMHNREHMLHLQQKQKRKAQKAKEAKAKPVPISAGKRLRSESIRSLLGTSFLATSLTSVHATPIPEIAQTSQFNSDTVGVVFAWACMCSYLSSRFPQIYKNHVRKSTSGTSILLFAAAFTGNLTYTLSILLSPQLSLFSLHEDKEFLMKELPFLLGASGTLLFDTIIFLQGYIYKENTKKRDDEVRLAHTPLPFMYQTPIWTPKPAGRPHKIRELDDGDVSDHELEINLSPVQQRETTPLISSSVHSTVGSILHDYSER